MKYIKNFPKSQAKKENYKHFQFSDIYLELLKGDGIPDNLKGIPKDKRKNSANFIALFYGEVEKHSRAMLPYIWRNYKG